MTIVEKQLSSVAPSQQAWESTQRVFLQGGNADQVLAWRSSSVDLLVTEAHAAFLAASAPAGLALLAVGGYGRRHLFPYSDIDLLVLFDNDRAAQNSKALLSPFLQQLWDSGLRVSHSVRTPVECTTLHERNVELNISLLDARFLAGDAALSGKLSGKLARFVHAQRQTLIRNLALLTRERHLKYHDTIYHLEPNIKETPGGLRDYQLLCWLAQIRNTVASRMGEAPAIAELEPARKFLFHLRCYLHYQAGRDANALSFDAQEGAAELTGKNDTAQWMREYFRHARDIYRAALRLLDSSEAQTSSLFSQFRDWQSRLSNSEFSVLRERLYFRTPQQLAQEPDLILRCFEFVARHGIRLSQDAEERISTHRGMLKRYFAESRSLWTPLSRILALPNVQIALKAMQETGILNLIFPEMEDIECLVIRDFYHRYTVDEHTLIAIQTIRDLRSDKDPGVRPYADLLSELESPAILYFSLLFHDAGKSDPNEGHVDGSLRVSEGAMARIQMPEQDREMVRFLIGRHLDMSATLHERDLDEPSTVQTLAYRMGTVERLKALTLLTYGDISAVNPGAMTPWRRSQLFRLYMLTYNELTRELETGRIEARSTDSADKLAFLAGFPKRYLRTHTPEEIDAHFRMQSAMAEHGVAIELAKTEGAYRLTLLTSDRPFLLASIAGTLSSFGMNILKAEAFANHKGAVLDTFAFADTMRSLELNPTEVDRLKATLERVVLGQTDVRQLLKNRPKASLPSRGARLAPSISFNSEASEAATLIQIVAEDRPGLLYDLAATMSAEECNIEVVLIDTEAHKAIDVFYVTSGGAKLDTTKQQQLQAGLLHVCSGGGSGNLPAE
ncbi:MAG: hypothetical protein ABIZ80_08700 [Bryobacteraceae bacterium]